MDGSAILVYPQILSGLFIRPFGFCVKLRFLLSYNEFHVRPDKVLGFTEGLKKVLLVTRQFPVCEIHA